MKATIRLIALLWCALTFASSGMAQQLSNMGKDFWIGYGHHVRMVNSSVPEKMQLYITSDVATTGKVTISGIGFEQSFDVIPKQITTIDIPRNAALIADGLYDLGIHVTAQKPVVVYSFIYVSAISGATVCLPTNTLGRDYYSVNFTQAANEANCSSYFFVVAADTGTTSVEITPAAATKSGKQAGTPFLVHLRQGQVYQVLGSTNGNKGADLTGSHIRTVNTGSGCKKIAVYSGSSKMSIGCSNANTSDNLYQQAYPTAAWGQKYIALSSMRNGNNFFRVIRPDASAVVKVNNKVVPANAFTNNFYYQFSGNGTYVIESDKAILVAQYFTTQGCMGNNDKGDPEMIFLNPVSQTLKEGTLNSMQPQGVNIRDHYLNIVLPNTPGALNSFKLDGAAVQGFQPVAADPSFAFARIRTVTGAHNLDCDSGFNVIAYGFGEAESYGYSGGTRLRNLYQFAAVQNEYATLDYAATCAGAPFRLSMTFPFKPQVIHWRFGGVLPDADLIAPEPDSTWKTNGQQVYRYTIPQWMKAPAEGTYTVKLIVSNNTGDGCTAEQEIEHELLVHPAAKAAFTLQTGGCLGDKVTVQERYSANNALAASKWLWSFSNGDTAMRRAPQPSYEVAGSYPITLAVINEIGVITDTAVQTANIHPLPTNKFTTNAQLCAGKPVGFTNMATVASGSIDRYIWTLGDGTQVVQERKEPFFHAYEGTGNYTVVLETVTDQGCSNAPAKQVLSLAPAPTARFSIPGSCLADPYAQFLNSSTLASGQLRYAWNFGDTVKGLPGTDTVQNPKHRYVAAGNYTVTLIASSEKGCADTLVQVVRVNGSVPKADFDLEAGLRQCSDKAVTLINKGSVDVGKLEKLEMYWDYNGNRTNMITDQEPAPGKQYRFQPPPSIAPIARQYTIRMVAYSGNSCFDTLQKTVTIDPLPELKFDTVPRVCSADGPFLITQAAVINNVQGRGTFSGSGINESGLFSPAKAAAGINAITYSFTSQWGCRQNISQNIVVARSPKVDAGADMMVRRGKQETLKASSTGVGLQYQWSPAEGLSNPTLLQPAVRPLQDEVYRLTAISPEGCTAFDEVRITAPDAVYIPNSFTPNGDGHNDSWRIPFLTPADKASVQVFNRDGYCVYVSKGLANWDGKCKGAPLPSGTYVYLVQLAEAGQVLKGTLTLIR